VFSRQSSSIFSEEKPVQQTVVTTDDSNEPAPEQIRTALENMPIEAIWVGNEPNSGEVVIGDRVYRTGDDITIEVRQRTMSLKITAIEENKLSFSWEGQTFDVAMVQSDLTN
jgi:hypothetical protein